MKKEKGIALITLVVAILMMLIISSVIIFNTTSHIKMQNLNNMYNDIKLLNEKVFLYYSKNKELPVLDGDYKILADVGWRYKEDGESEYWFNILDLEKIDKNLKTPTHSALKYGEDYYKIKNDGESPDLSVHKDLYIINKSTFQIYYVKGIEMDKVLYYTIPDSENVYKEKFEGVKVEANPPVLETNLEPVKLTNNDSTITLTNPYDKDWYKYTYGPDLTLWARARVKQTGTNNNEELYMWVPRFAYKYVNGELEIQFLKGTTNKPLDGEHADDEDYNIKNDGWEIPAAFETREGTPLSGIWLKLDNEEYKLRTASVAENQKEQYKIRYIYKYINSHVDLLKYFYEQNGKDNTQGSSNTTITGGTYSAYNPIIPQGYKTVETAGCSWVSSNGTRVDGWNKGNGWDEGLTIENGQNGAQYIWVPISSTAEYDTWYTNHAASLNNFDAGDLQNQINLYSGFYITKEKTNNKATILYLTDEKDNRAGTANIKLGAGKYAYNNPVIPAGFRAVNTVDANWNVMPDGSIEGWNEGLVIQDTLGNEYVWVPVDGENIKFEQHEYVKTAASEQSLNPVDIDTSNTTQDTGNGNWRTYRYRNYMDWKNMMVTGTHNVGNTTIYDYEDKMIERITSVNKYGGFYIARYEAGWSEAEPDVTRYTPSKGSGVENQLPISKKGYVVWNHIKQPDADIVCNRLNGVASYSSVNAGLVDGYAWDTLENWLELKGNNITNGYNKGNYVQGTATVTNAKYKYIIYRNPKVSGVGAALWYKNLYYREYLGNGMTITRRSLSGTELTTLMTEAGVQNEIDTSKYDYYVYIELCTGEAEFTKMNNIYDLAGNMWEWTTEIGNYNSNNANQNRTTQNTESTTYSPLRGGAYNVTYSYYPSSVRYSYNVQGADSNVGFRAVLYVK